MLFIGGDGDKIQFVTSKKITDKYFTCSLTQTFNIHLSSENTAIFNNRPENVVFLLPVHFPSFCAFLLEKKKTISSLKQSITVKEKTSKSQMDKKSRQGNKLSLHSKIDAKKMEPEYLMQENNILSFLDTKIIKNSSKTHFTIQANNSEIQSIKKARHENPIAKADKQILLTGKNIKEWIKQDFIDALDHIFIFKKHDDKICMENYINNLKEITITKLSIFCNH